MTNELHTCDVGSPKSRNWRTMLRINLMTKSIGWCLRSKRWREKHHPQYVDQHLACMHKKRKDRCALCTPESRCQHSRDRRYCPLCRPATAYKTYMTGCKKRSLDPLCFDEYVRICVEDCDYCGQPFAGGVDRVDNAKGYPNNSVPCCWPCNKAKGSQTRDVFLDTCMRVSKHSRKRYDRARLAVTEER